MFCCSFGCWQPHDQGITNHHPLFLCYRLVFYVMAPLISSNGHRVGTLCIMGQEPRKFDATRGAILANLSELLVSFELL